MSALESQLLRLELVHVLHADLLIAAVFGDVVQHRFERFFFRQVCHELLIAMYQLVDNTVFVQ